LRERALRTVLLVKAIEETDRAGELLPPADRVAATRDVLRDEPGLRGALEAPQPGPAWERFLAARADRLRRRLAPRHPIVQRLAGDAGGAAWFGRAVLVGAFALGLALSALDASRRVNLLAFPLAGLIAWNLAVYVALAVAMLRTARHEPRTAWYEGFARRRLERALRESAQYDATLGRALAAFAAQWHGTLRPWLGQRARALFHAGAMLVALGLVAGLYVRGIGFEYRAGWESTFLSSGAARAVFAVLYGPASAVSGVPLPATDDAVAALRWPGTPGVVAAPWIHLIAITVLLYVVLPRAVLALLAMLRAARLARRAELPADALPYARAALAELGIVAGARDVDLVAYGALPGTAALEALARVLGAAFAAPVRLASCASVPYGDEDAFVARFTAAAAPATRPVVVLYDLAATAETENHGRLLAELRDALARTRRDAQPIVLVDASAYAARMGAGARLEERARAWREFVAQHGARAVVVDLARLDDAALQAAAGELRAASAGVAA
jgi:hypothetical protein